MTELELLEEIVTAEILTLARQLKAEHPELNLSDTEWIDRAISTMHAHRSYILTRLEEHWKKVGVSKS